MFKLKQFSKYIKHTIFARHARGFGIHSPLLFFFTRSVIYNKYPYYCYTKIEDYRRELLQSSEKVQVESPIAEIPVQQDIRHIAKTTINTPKCAQLFFRIAVYAKAKNILEIGPSLGITTLYLASTHSKAKCVALEEQTSIAQIAQNYYNKKGYQNIFLKVGNITQTLPLILSETKKVDLVLFHTNQTKEATLDYFEQCLAKKHEQSIFIFDNILLNQQVLKTWMKIKENKHVTASFDLNKIGLVFFDKNLQKKNYKVRF